MNPSGDEWRGRLIDGRYQVESVLGKGGMGLVFRARHKFTGASVAVKMLHPHMKLRGDLADRFLAEARAPTAIGHPGIVTVLDAGATPEGDLYLVMELLQGEPLRDLASRGRLPLAAVRRIGLELLAALAAAHAAGFIHRDLKPENIFITTPGTVKLLDFGIAKVLADDVVAKGQTAVGTVLGTLWYMAPEQLNDSRSVDHRADLWALGVIIYELLSGLLPYRAETVVRMMAAMMMYAPEPIERHLPGAPPALGAFLTRALAREPQQRFQSAAEMAAALAALPVGPEGDLPLAWLLGRRSPSTGPVGFAATAAASAPAGTGWSPPVGPQSTGPVWQPPPPPPSPSRDGTGPVWQPPLPPPPRDGTGPIYQQPREGTGPVWQPPPAPVPQTVAVTPPARPRRSRSGLVVGGVVALGLVVGGVVFAVVGGGGGGAGGGGGGGTPTPAALTDRPRVETPRPRDALDDLKHPPPQDPPPPLTIPDQTPPAPQPQPQLTPAPTPSPPRDLRSDAQACADGCKLLSRCGMVVNAACEPGCMASPLTIACAHKANDCNSAASCVLVSVCGGVGPRGHATCAATGMCEGRCGNDFACGCRCAQSMSPRHAAALVNLSQCAASCNNDLACARERCSRQIVRCQNE